MYPEEASSPAPQPVSQVPSNPYSLGAWIGQEPKYFHEIVNTIEKVDFFSHIQRLSEEPDLKKKIKNLPQHFWDMGGKIIPIEFIKLDANVFASLDPTERKRRMFEIITMLALNQWILVEHNTFQELKYFQEYFLVNEHSLRQFMMSSPPEFERHLLPKDLIEMMGWDPSSPQEKVSSDKIDRFFAHIKENMLRIKTTAEFESVFPSANRSQLELPLFFEEHRERAECYFFYADLYSEKNDLNALIVLYSVEGLSKNIPLNFKLEEFRLKSWYDRCSLEDKIKVNINKNKQNSDLPEDVVQAMEQLPILNQGFESVMQQLKSEPNDVYLITKRDSLATQISSAGRTIEKFNHHSQRRGTRLANEYVDPAKTSAEMDACSQQIASAATSLNKKLGDELGGKKDINLLKVAIAICFYSALLEDDWVFLSFRLSDEKVLELKYPWSRIIGKKYKGIEDRIYSELIENDAFKRVVKKITLLLNKYLEEKWDEAFIQSCFRDAISICLSCFDISTAEFTPAFFFTPDMVGCLYKNKTASVHGVKPKDCYEIENKFFRTARGMAEGQYLSCEALGEYVLVGAGVAWSSGIITGRAVKLTLDKREEFLKAKRWESELSLAWALPYSHVLYQFTQSTDDDFQVIDYENVKFILSISFTDHLIYPTAYKHLGTEVKTRRVNVGSPSKAPPTPPRVASPVAFPDALNPYSQPTVAASQYVPPASNSMAPFDASNPFYDHAPQYVPPASSSVVPFQASNPYNQPTVAVSQYMPPAAGAATSRPTSKPSAYSAYTPPEAIPGYTPPDAILGANQLVSSSLFAKTYAVAEPRSFGIPPAASMSPPVASPHQAYPPRIGASDSLSGKTINAKFHNIIILIYGCGHECSISFIPDSLTALYETAFFGLGGRQLTGYSIKCSSASQGNIDKFYKSIYEKVNKLTADLKKFKITFSETTIDALGVNRSIIKVESNKMLEFRHDRKY